MATTPRQMIDHLLEPLKGWMPDDMATLDYSAPLSHNVTFAPVFAGRVVHLNVDGEYEMGCNGKQMALFLFADSDDFDVNNEGGDGWTPTNAGCGIPALVATGGFEFATTEFISAALTYAPNDPLRGIASNTDPLTGGMLTKATPITLGTNAICGVVSSGVSLNHERKSILSFWPVYCPGSGA